MIIRVITIFSFFFALTGQAHAKTDGETVAPQWLLSTFSNKYSDGEIIQTKVKNVPGNVSFSCTSKSQFYVSVWRGPLIVTHEGPKRVIRRDTRKVKLFINDVKSKITRWYYTDAGTIISPANIKTKGQLYNAAVRGDKVTLIFKKDLPITLILPKPNDAFARFGRDCGLSKVS